MQKISPQETTLLQKAVSLHQAGALNEAEQFYQAILNQNPVHPDANHNLGVLALQCEKFATALHYLEMALLVKPDNIQYSLTYADALLKYGDAKQAHSFITESILQSSQLANVRDFRTQVKKMADTFAVESEKFDIAQLHQAVKNSTLKKANNIAKRQIQVGLSERLSQQFLINRAALLHQHAHFYALECLCRALIDIDKQNRTAWVALGNALLKQDKPSLDECREAVKLSPSEATAHINLGVSLTKNNKLDEAIVHFTHALKLNSNDADAHYNLGCGKAVRGKWREAEAHFRQALQIRPQFVTAQHNLGVALKSLGDFPQAQSYLRSAVQNLYSELKESPNLCKQARTSHNKKKPIDLEAAHSILDEIRYRLSNAKIAWCLFAGSALGIFRDGDLLPFDKDLDIAIHTSVDRTLLLSSLLKGGVFEILSQYAIKEEANHQYSLSILHVSSKISVDIFFLTPDENEDFFLVGAYHPVQAILCRINRFDFMEFPWRGKTWSIPSSTERYFEEIYGSGWRQPDKGFDTVLSNPSRIAQAMPVVVCYAYSNIFSSLRAGNWYRTQTLCQQLLLHISDPVLSELQAWLSTQKSKTESIL